MQQTPLGTCVADIIREVDIDAAWKATKLQGIPQASPTASTNAAWGSANNRVIPPLPIEDNIPNFLPDLNGVCVLL